MPRGGVHARQRVRLPRHQTREPPGGRVQTFEALRLWFRPEDRRRGRAVKLKGPRPADRLRRHALVPRARAAAGPAVRGERRHHDAHRVRAASGHVGRRVPHG